MFIPTRCRESIDVNQGAGWNGTKITSGVVSLATVLKTMWCDVTVFPTRGRRFTDKGDQVVLDLIEGIVVVDQKHVSLAGLAADESQLCYVNISNSNHKHTVACGGKEITQKKKTIV